MGFHARDPHLIAGSGRSPGREMATHSSLLTWEIPWTEEPGGLQVTRVKHVLATTSLPWLIHFVVQ